VFPVSQRGVTTGKKGADLGRGAGLNMARFFLLLKRGPVFFPANFGGGLSPPRGRVFLHLFSKGLSWGVYSFFKPGVKKAGGEKKGV